MQDQIHLNQKYMSRRGVRVRMLDTDEHSAVLSAAALLTPEKGKVIELKKNEWRLGAKAFIVAYTDPCDDPTAPGTKWVKADQATMDASFKQIFNAKDCGVLENMYREYHEVSEAEVEAVAGKALPVSAD